MRSRFYPKTDTIVGFDGKEKDVGPIVKYEENVVEEIWGME
jgi:hypothetical protein